MARDQAFPARVLPCTASRAHPDGTNIQVTAPCRQRLQQNQGDRSTTNCSFFVAGLAVSTDPRTEQAGTGLPSWCAIFKSDQEMALIPTRTEWLPTAQADRTRGRSAAARF